MEAGRAPQRINLKLYAGDSDTFTFTLDETVDVTQGQWAAQIKPEGHDVIESFAVAVTDAVVLSIDAATSQRLGAFKEPLRWDLQQTFDDFNVTTHAGGYLIMTPDVTPIGDATPGAPPDGPAPDSIELMGGGHLLLTGGGLLVLNG